MAKDNSWKPEIAITQQMFNPDLRGWNLKLISPRFEIETEDDYWTEEREAHPEKYQKARFLYDVFYAPPHQEDDMNDISEFSIAGDLLYDLIHTRRFSLGAMGGLRCYLIRNDKYGLINHKKIYYWDWGLTAQLDLGFVSPFVEFKRLGYYSAGAMFSFHAVYRKPSKKYKLHRRLSR